ncbi:InlB B-repeat-containing protein [Bacteroides heparinolyticus]|uniref:InlB B-repeat-containing protein n=3 Tax=Prevotella heparinolytica TaxID=28113 RepID=UPI00359F70AF
MKRILFITLLGIAIMGLASCGKDEVKTHFTVTFDTDGGAPVPEVQRVEKGKTAVAPLSAPAKKDFVFVCWSADGTNAYSFQTPVTHDLTLRAKWQAETEAEYWQVTWELNGGAWPTEGDNHATQVLKGGTLAEPAPPAKANHTFEGWYKEAALSNKVDFPYDVSGVTANFTLYAKWKSETPLSLDKTSLTLRTTDRDKLTVSGISTGISWSSSDTQVAKVSEEGIVTATGAGTAVIKAAVGSKSATCDVSVTPSVLVVGDNPYGDKKMIIWKNGEELDLGSYAIDATIKSSVFVYDGDIYITGRRGENFSGNRYDDVEVMKIQCAVPGGSSQTTSTTMDREGRSAFSEGMFISSGGDIYVAGYEILKRPGYSEEYERAILWKNGTRQVLFDNQIGEAEARSVFVAGNDVYATGNKYDSDAVIWKNGQMQELARPEGCIKTKAYSVFVAGNDVYVAGEASYEDNPIDTYKPILWKNNVPTVLDADYGTAYTVVASGSDVYAGGQGRTASVWKNGVAESYAGRPLIKSVYVYDGKLYAIEEGGLWIDGVKQSWGNYGTSVFVK